MNEEPLDPRQDAELEAFADALHEDLSDLRWQGWDEGQAPSLPARSEPRISRASTARWAVAAALLIAVAMRPWLGTPAPEAIYGVSLADRTGEGTTGYSSVEMIGAGQVVETAAGRVARIEVPELGEVQLDPGSRLRIGDAEQIDGEHFLELERGAATAAIFASPRRFQLGTPAGIAVDLGCVYRTEVAENGRTHVAVLAGAVSLEAEGREVYVPQGASVWATPETGPGTPIWDDASDELRHILARLDEGGTLKIDSDDFYALFELARPRDALSVWHLMVRSEGSQRYTYAKLLDRLVPMPDEFEPEECVEADGPGHQAWRQLQPWS